MNSGNNQGGKTTKWKGKVGFFRRVIKGVAVENKSWSKACADLGVEDSVSIKKMVYSLEILLNGRHQFFEEEDHESWIRWSRRHRVTRNGLVALVDDHVPIITTKRRYQRWKCTKELLGDEEDEQQ